MQQQHALGSAQRRHHHVPLAQRRCLVHPQQLCGQNEARPLQCASAQFRDAPSGSGASNGLLQGTRDARRVGAPAVASASAFLENQSAPRGQGGSSASSQRPSGAWQQPAGQQQQQQQQPQPQPRPSSASAPSAASRRPRAEPPTPIAPLLPTSSSSWDDDRPAVTSQGPAQPPAADLEPGAPLRADDAWAAFEARLEADLATTGTTLVAILGVICFWRGTWSLLDYYLGDSPVGDLACVLCGFAIILWIRLSGLKVGSFWPSG